MKPGARAGEGEAIDCLVVGGGAAGLMAAVYLGRYRRRAVVVDDGGSRLAMIPRSHNVLGFPEGIAGPQLLENMRRHAERFGVPMELGRVEGLVRRPDGTFEAVAGTRRLRARFVLLATGARDVEPDAPACSPRSKAARCATAPCATASRRRAGASPCSGRMGTACAKRCSSPASATG
jgi:thioredoxin reductase (NADPH)